MYHVLHGAVNGDWDEVLEGLSEQWAASGGMVVSGVKKVGTKVKNKVSGSMEDGILRPDGTITQVAPDDWVFAARNLGDLARAFTPHNYTAASSSEYVINQTFNINGGSDMPQVLRQQAYRGTQEGLLEIMNQSSQRLQLMSGTR